MDVDLGDLSRSYPFLDLSRKLKLSYELVLAVADSIDDKTDGHRVWYGGKVWHAALLVCNAPWRWQYPPQGRGL